MNAALIENAPQHTFKVLLTRRASLETSLVALVARCKRKGLTPMTWTWGRPVARVNANDIDTTYIPLFLSGDLPRFSSWTFIAVLEHLDGENIIRATDPSAIIPALYRTRGPQCDHCNTLRRRSDTFLLRHTDGTIQQVGRTCLADFLGNRDALDLASQASLFAQFTSLASDGDEDTSPSGTPSGGDMLLARYLSYAASCIQQFGWTSRTKASHDAPATADLAFGFARGNGLTPSDEDKELGLAAEAWAESLTDDAVNASPGDYLHNLRAIARSGFVNHRSIGLAASMVVAYQRAIGVERQRAAEVARPVLDAYVGTLGKRETFIATLERVGGFDTAYGYTTVLTLRTDAGATLVWKSSSTGIDRSDVGKRYSVTGSVKAHEEYKGAKQTSLTRCKLIAL